MKHLFIINPAAEKIKGKVDTVLDDIKAFFASNSQLEFDYHITRWIRDASAFVHRYVLDQDGLVRVHSYGGSGTLFEIVNGIVGLPNVQVSAYPMGKNNSLLRYFGKEKLHLFSSLRNQVFSDVTPIDALRCGRNYGISYGLVGLEAESAKIGTEMIERSHIKHDLYYVLSAASAMQKRSLSKRYSISLDGRQLDGDYISMMVANIPCYGKNMNPAVDAHPNDGQLELYIVKDASKLAFVSMIPKYIRGHYDKTRGHIEHHSGKKLVISSEHVMCLAVDGETFYEDTIEYEIMPYAIDLVCPQGIDPGKLPRIYGRPEEGYVNA